MKKFFLILFSLIILASMTVVCFVSVTADDEFVYLSDMQPKSSNVGWGELGVDRGLDGAKIKIANNEGGKTTYDKGLCAHASSSLVYDLSGNVYSQFVAYIGVHEGTNNNSKDAASVAFEVKIDGVSKYKSSVMRMSTPAQLIEVDIPVGAQKIELITTDGGDGNTGDHSAWADAKLRLGEADPNMVVDAIVELDSTEVKIGSTVKADVKQKLFSGAVEVPAKGSVKFSTSDASVAEVNSEGEITFKGIGSVTLFVELTHDKGVVEKEIMLKCYNPDLEGMSWSVTSFSGENTVNICMGIYGELTYSVTHGNEVVVDPGSDMGLISNEVYFADGFKFVSCTTAEIDERYTNISGKTSAGYNHAKEITIRFEKGIYYFDVIARAYDDGFAYRYNICFKDESESGTLTFTGEHTSFVLPEKSVSYAIIVPDLTSVFNHENSYSTIKAENVKNKYIAFPILYETTEKTWVLLTEAELYGDDYYGSMVKGEENRELRFHQAPRVSMGSVTTDANFTSPWRMGIIGDLETIVESNLVEDVHVRSDVDYSWVKPGVTSWMWLSEGFSGQYDYNKLKEYIDLAYEMGWNYIILDEGWQPAAPAGSNRRYNGYYSWFDNLVKYANERDVGLIVWIRIEDFDTAKEREIVREWAAKGIKGIKADFFDSEAPEMIAIYNALYDICTEEKMLINCHGANKPTGERQFYANVINREAVNGEEYGGYSTANTTIWAFARGVLGPMDVTPRLYPTKDSETTVGHQLAMNVVFESGMPCMASSANEYLTTNAYMMLKDLPAAWDEIEYIDGAPGKYTILARRSGSQWYVGGLNNTGTKNITLTLDFLDDGAEYVAFTFYDGKGKYDLKTDCKTVKKGDTLTFGMYSHSGFSVRLVKKDDTSTVNSITYDTTSYTVKAGESFVIIPNISPANLRFDDLKWTSSDEKIAIVNRGSVNALRTGTVLIRAESYFDSKVYLELKVNVTEGHSLNSQLSILDPTIAEYGYTVNDNGDLILKTVTGDINGSYRNVVYMDAPEGDFEVIIKVVGRFMDESQTAGIILFSESDRSRAISLAKRYYNPDGDQYNTNHYFSLYSYKNSGFSSKIATGKNGINTAYLKLTVTDGVVKGYYNISGQWTPIAGTVSDSTLMKMDDLKIGFFSGAGQHGDVAVATFADLSVNGQDIPFFGETVYVEKNKVTSNDVPAEPVKVVLGTLKEKIELPKSVTFTLDNGETFTSSVKWKCAAYNSGTPGEYTFTAEATEIPKNVDASTAVATVKVVVEEKSETPETPETPETAEPTVPTESDDNDTIVIIISITAIVVALIIGAVLFLLRKKK